MIRVLHLHSGNMFGGVETLLATLARHAEHAEELDQHFALCADARLADELRQAGSPVHVVGMARLSRPLSIWRARRRIRALISEIRPDVVVAHSVWVQAVFGPTLRPKGTRQVLWVHDTVDGRDWLQKIARLNPPHEALCNSRYTLGLLPGAFPGLDAEVLIYPVAASGLSPHEAEQTRQEVRREMEVPAGDVVIAQVSRLEPYKGHRLHLEALSRIRDLPNWRCWIVGGAQRPEEREYLESLRRLTAHLEIADRVSFLGQRSDVGRLLNGADIHCQPNIRPEPFGIVFVEALRAGLPVVTTGMGGAVEIVDQTCGIVTPPDDADALAEALRRLIEERSLRETLGAAGPERAKSLTDPATQMRGLQSFLRRAVQKT